MFGFPQISPYQTWWRDWDAYWADRMQRVVLTLDVLRQRGNVYLEHSRAGQPPVLVFDYEMILDGRTLDRPANYALVRILPPPDCPADAKKRPFVVIDPRAGHGPGIGGSKIDSEIGIALREGHPCYFVMFFPEPVPGQTIECVSLAEVAFMKEVIARHPDAEGKPLVIGNCQGGWALVMLASQAPELVGPLLLAGTPLSYWAGVEGKNPMRYHGGLLGGTWTASLLGDLGAGKFDGAWLVYNFEQLNPANTYFSKPYRLFAKVDTEAERFLEFEKWWGGHFLLNREEIDWIVQNLFVGNRLAGGEITLANGQHRIDLRNIRSPIVVFASFGDNITPPQQALNWIPDVYADVEDIRAHGQTIVYCLHEHIGHLGIFVSAGVAQREHAELVSAIDLIDTLVPGLYEAVIEDTRPDMPNFELINGRYFIRFEPRTIDDILKLGDGREHENRFELVRRVAEVNQAMYDQFVSPWVRACSNELSARMMRALHPARFERYMFSDLNPWLWPLASMAHSVRQHRHVVSEDNLFVALEREGAKLIEDSLNRYRDQRDHFTEQVFKKLYDAPWLSTLLGARKARRGPMSLQQQLERLNLKGALHDFDHGGALDTFVRVMTYIRDDHVIDERPFNLMRRIVNDKRVDPITLEQYRDSVQRQSRVLMLDEDRAMQGLLRLLPDMERRLMVMGFVHEVLHAAGPIEGEILARYRHVCALLGTPDLTQPQPEAVAASAGSATPRRPRRKPKA
jgi:pimeloyl-ACP methyl ester carboxylesterase